MKMKLKDLVIAILIPLSIGIISSFLSKDAMMSFDILNKPPLFPPSWIFPIIWSILYILMGISSYFIYISDDKNKKSALLLYALSLIFNFIWPILFFNFKLYFFSFLWLMILWITIIFTIIYFYPINDIAAYILIPYLIWVSFAGYLNYAIAILNK